MWTLEDTVTIELEITNHCNIACVDCIRSDSHMVDHLNDEHLDLDLIKTKINRSIFPNLKLITFCGSVDEPLMHPKIVEWIDWALNDLDCRVDISTNASLRSTEFWSGLAKFGPRLQIRFAIDGLDDETNKKYRVGANYEKAMGNAKAFIAAGGNAIWQFIVFPWNEHQVDEYYTRSTDYGFTTTRLIETKRKMGLSDTSLTEPISKEMKCLFMDKNKIFINHKARLVSCCYHNYHDLKYKGEYGSSDYGDMMMDEGGELYNSLVYNDMPELFDTYLKGIHKQPLKECIRVCNNRGPHNIIVKSAG